MKTSTKRKAIVKETGIPLKKRVRPAVSKKKNNAELAVEKGDEAMRKYLDQVGVDNDPGIDVPLHIRGGHFKWNFQKRMPWYDKVTWVLTGVNVAILGYLIIKNLN